MNVDYAACGIGGTMPRPGLCREDQDEPAKALGIQGVLAHRSFSTRHSPEAWD